MSRRWVVATAGLLAAVLTGGPASGGTYGSQRSSPCETTIKPPPPKCANFECSDPMFTVSHPPRGTYVSGHCAELTLPFAFYDATFTALLGPADLAALGSITAGSGYHPVATEDGHGVAALIIGDSRDTNAGPYIEIGVFFPVNEEKVTVSAQNPYAYLSETLNPENKVWMHKWVLSEQMPIDYFLEMMGYDKNPVPQDITVRTTADDTTFAAADPNGNPILSGRLAFDTGPKVQAEAGSQAVTAPHGGKWLERFLTRGALVELNLVNPDTLHRSAALMESYALVRIKSTPALGLFGPESSLTVDPSSDFGAAVRGLDFHPVVGARFPLRMHIDNGSLP
jgi:hypothetical protein